METSSAIEGQDITINIPSNTEENNNEDNKSNGIIF